MFLKKYLREHFRDVLQTTLNPEGPGVVRIHLIPPKYESGKPVSSVAIINGQDIIPVNYAWSILLAELIKEINKYHGREVTDAEVEDILSNTCKAVKKVFPVTSAMLSICLCNSLFDFSSKYTETRYIKNNNMPKKKLELL